MYSCLVSYHTNPYTCGVARFNLSLARVVGLDVTGLEEFLTRPASGTALLSLKLEEIEQESLNRLNLAIQKRLFEFDLFLHASAGSRLEEDLCRRAGRIFAASAEIASQVASVRPDVVAGFAPGAPVLPRELSVDCRLLTFGMAHKIRSDGYQKLASLLQHDARSFRLEISTALHEGGTFDESFFTVSNQISLAFSGNVRFLGFLADAEVSERLREVDAMVAFFPKGVRENNTTVLSAMSHGCPVITNLDVASPPWMVHGSTVFDIKKLSAIPTKSDLSEVGEAGMRLASQFSFERLAKLLIPRVK